MKEIHYKGVIIKQCNGIFSLQMGPNYYYGNRLDKAIEFIENQLESKKKAA